jgi:hypothetical protein
VELIIAPRFNGPPASANGGYTCGLLAELVGEPAEVTLRAPPPLDTAMRFDGEHLWHGETLVAEARPSELELDVPPPVSHEDAERASRGYPGFAAHEYPTCFVCGPARDDGLGVFAGAVDGTGVFAAPWLPPDDVSRTLVWAALDCPGAIGVGWDGRGDWLLGRMTGEVLGVPAPGERCVVVAWPLGHEGRKGFAGTAVYRGDELLARARQTWIALREEGSEK